MKPRLFKYSFLVDTLAFLMHVWRFDVVSLVINEKQTGNTRSFYFWALPKSAQPYFSVTTFKKILVSLVFFCLNL